MVRTKMIYQCHKDGVIVLVDEGRYEGLDGPPCRVCGSTTELSGISQFGYLERREGHDREEAMDA